MGYFSLETRIGRGLFWAGVRRHHDLWYMSSANIAIFWALVLALILLPGFVASLAHNGYPVLRWFQAVFLPGLLLLPAFAAVRLRVVAELLRRGRSLPKALRLGWPALPSAHLAGIAQADAAGTLPHVPVQTAPHPQPWRRGADLERSYPLYLAALVLYNIQQVPYWCLRR